MFAIFRTIFSPYNMQPYATHVVEEHENVQLQVTRNEKFMFKDGSLYSWSKQKIAFHQPNYREKFVCRGFVHNRKILAEEKGQKYHSFGVEQYSLYRFEDVAMKNPKDVVDSHEMVNNRDTYISSLWQQLAFAFAKFFSSNQVREGCQSTYYSGGGWRCLACLNREKNKDIVDTSQYEKSSRVLEFVHGEIWGILVTKIDPKLVLRGSNDHLEKVPLLKIQSLSPKLVHTSSKGVS